jgi:flagellin-like protein
MVINLSRKMLKKFSRYEKGIAGLETAIILITFVVVAAVFAYTTLSARCCWIAFYFFVTNEQTWA